VKHRRLIACSLLDKSGCSFVQKFKNVLLSKPRVKRSNDTVEHERRIIAETEVVLNAETNHHHHSVHHSCSPLFDAKLSHVPTLYQNG